ncbi:MAG: sigma-70 family RNA polymerase sigma factor, partial [Chloroflexota bacterium]|nr:sigma-70 family RNA polymerase sigma factor [Chloroflexota bacterium]
NMIVRGDDLQSQIHTVACLVIRRCAQEILTPELLTEQILREWIVLRKGVDHPSHQLLTRIALRICSRALCQAWRSPQIEVRNAAFANLRRYLEGSLRSTGYASTFQQNASAAEDVLQQVLEEMHLSVTRNPLAGPDDQASFLKWAQTALIRHAHAYVWKCEKEPCFSLEKQQEQYNDIADDEQHQNPQQYVERHELQQALKDAILSLRNLRYRQVLLYTYLADMNESELADLLHVSVQEIYMWRYRALRALRNKEELMQILQAWRE